MVSSLVESYYDILAVSIVKFIFLQLNGFIFTKYKVTWAVFPYAFETVLLIGRRFELILE